jgi:DNA-binding HxlR family transcriptional regulator
MTKKATEPTTESFDTCANHPLGRAIRLVGDVPTLLIICALMPGTRRFGEIRSHEGLTDISPKTISQRLKMLEALEVVQRQAYAEIPPRVEYWLTEKGRALHDIIEALQHFGERYLAGETPPLPPA